MNLVADLLNLRGLLLQRVLQFCASVPSAVLPLAYPPSGAGFTARAAGRSARQVAASKEGFAFMPPTRIETLAEGGLECGWIGLAEPVCFRYGRFLRGAAAGESETAINSNVRNKGARSITAWAADFKTLPRFCVTEATSTRMPRRRSLVAR